MSENLRQIVEIVGQDQVSATLRTIIDTLRSLERQADRTRKALKASFGAEMVKPLAKVREEARGFGVDLADAGERAARALRADVAALGELRSALRGAATDEKALGAAMRAAHTASAGTVQRQTVAARNAATGRARAAAADLRAVRSRWRIREASERAERHGIDATGAAWFAAQRRRMAVMARSEAVERRRQREADRAEAVKARVETIATDRRVRDVGRLWRMRERSEAAEARHLRTMARERDALRRRAMTSGRHAYGHARHAVRSVNHPVHESLGFALSAGAAAGGAFAEHVVRASEAFDTSMSRLRMFAPQLDADAIRKQALDDSVALGVDASVIVDSIAKSVRDGVPPAIAQSLPKSIIQTAQVMGGDIERLTDSLAEGIQESTAMGWIKDQSDARRFLNLEAGLSTTAGNTSKKTEQFIAAGGLGHGKEIGLDLEKTMAYGAMLNASGARTGQASARFMGQLSQNVPKMFDKYQTAVESRKNSEEDRAVRSAPGKLGYGGVREMQSRIMAGPEGLIDFATRLQRLDDKARKLVLEGYGFSEQGGAMLAELGSNGGAKGKAVLARAHELAEQKEANDYLSEKFAEWQKSLSFMLQQIEKGWRAIENEIGDVIKSDIIAPFRDWWTLLSEGIVKSDLKGRMHEAIAGFVHDLGFDDVRHLLDTMTGHVHGFDFAGFARGVGEGIRAVVDDLRSLASVFDGAGGLSAETVGRLATQFLVLSLSLRGMAPIVSTIGGIASAFLALKAAVEGVAWVARLTGLSSGLSAIVGVDLAAGAAGLMSFAGALGVISAAIQALLSSGILPRVSLLPKDGTAEGIDAWLWGKNKDGSSARPAWVDRLTGRDVPVPTVPTVPPGAPNPGAEAPSAYWARKNRYLHPSSFDGGDDGDGQSWRSLMTPASYSPSDSGDVMRGAMVDTASGVREVREAVDRLGGRLTLATFGSGGTGTGEGGLGSGGFGGGPGGSSPNIRYGRPHMGAGGSVGAGPGDAGGRASAMTGDVAGRAGKAMAKLMALGWTKEAAAAAIGNAQQESGVRSDGPLGDTKRFGFGDDAAHGMFQWRGQRFRDLKAFAARKGVSWQDFDAQVEFFDQESKKYGSGTWRNSRNVYEANVGMKRFEGYGDDSFGTRLANARQLAAGKTDGGFYPAADLGKPSAGTIDAAAAMGGGNVGRAVDLASKLDGMTSSQAGHALGSKMTPGEWCADFVNGALKAAGVKGSGSSMALSFQKWGHRVGFGDVKKGDVIVENHGRGHGHVGLATGAVKRDAAGNVVAVGMTSGNHGERVHRDYWESVRQIEQLRRSDEADPAEIARKVKGRPRGGSGTGDGAGSNVSADNSTVNHNTFHITHADPHHVARTVAAHLDRRSGATVDLDAFA